MAAMHLRVEGRVQGVGYRWFVRMHARRLQLAGWVRNLPDGSVEIAASGDQSKLDELRRIALAGPEGATVTGATDLEPVGELELPFALRK